MVLLHLQNQPELFVVHCRHLERLLRGRQLNCVQSAIPSSCSEYWKYTESTLNSNKKKPAVPRLFTVIYKMSNNEADKLKTHLHTLSATKYTGNTIKDSL